MLTVLLLLLAALGLAGAAWRYRAHWWPPVAQQPAPPSPAAAPPLTEGALPEVLEEDLLEFEDLQWLLAQRRAALEQERDLAIQRRESAARLEEIDAGLYSVQGRLSALEDRLRTLKLMALELEGLQLEHRQLQGQYLDRQYELESLRAENEGLGLELAASREEALEAMEEAYRLRKQLALLKNMTREADMNIE
ncbi:hypothetical protein [Flaviaesturariibacter amylovorans]|uniref:Uncharacterized protein n=1 Tax=Flaviaesturariibacter amylovorans TaxID=1084520 RepID=A0ABP8HQF8_9BACT